MLGCGGCRYRCVSLCWWLSEEYRGADVAEMGVWPCVSWKEKGFGVSDASQMPEQLGSGSKKLTPKNVLLGLQHVLVSNVWLDPVFVAGAIGLPLALSSNMVNAIFIV